MSNNFTYATVDDVKPMVKSLFGDKELMLERKLVMLSSKLSGLFPGLRTIWQEADEDSDLKNFVTSMVAEAGRKFIINPEGMSSETIGVFAYSRFDDGRLEPFSKEDLEALRRMLEAESTQVANCFKLGMGDNMHPAAPMPTPHTYSNSINGRSWSR